MRNADRWFQAVATMLIAADSLEQRRLGRRLGLVARNGRRAAFLAVVGLGLALLIVVGSSPSCAVEGRAASSAAPAARERIAAGRSRPRPGPPSRSRDAARAAELPTLSAGVQAARRAASPVEVLAADGAHPHRRRWCIGVEPRGLGAATGVVWLSGPTGMPGIRLPCAGAARQDRSASDRPACSASPSPPPRARPRLRPFDHYRDAIAKGALSDPSGHRLMVRRSTLRRARRYRARARRAGLLDERARHHGAEACCWFLRAASAPWAAAARRWWRLIVWLVMLADLNANEKGARRRPVPAVSPPAQIADVDPVLQRRFRRRADLVRHHFAVLEHEQRRDAAHAQLGRRFRVLVDVDLDDLHLACHLGRQLFQRRADLAAGAAPFGPEIDDDGNVGLAHFGIESGVRDGNGGHGNSPE